MAHDEGWDRVAFSDWVRPHLPAMVRLAARIGPSGAHDDIVQEALLRAWRHRLRYAPSRGPLSSWLLAIVANEARRAAKRRGLPIRIESVPRPAPVDDRLDIEIAIRKLPPRQRLAIDCYYYVGLSVAETAAAMACSEGTVKSTLADARTRLRALLEATE